MNNDHGEHDLHLISNSIFLSDCLICTCNHFCIHGIPCRHIYCVLQRFPEITDYNIKQLKAYESFHGRDEPITVLLSNQVTFSLKGPLVGESLILPPNSREGHDMNWFNELMDRIVLRPGVFSYYSNDTYASISQVTSCDDSSDGDIHFGNNHEDEPDEEDCKSSIRKCLEI